MVTGRVWRWVGGGLVLGLLPIAATFLFRYYRLERLPSLADVLGSGQSLVVAVSWFAAALREVRDVPRHMHAIRDAISIIATIFLLVAAMAYGFISADQLSGHVQSAKQQQIVTVGSLILLVIGGWLSGYAVAIGKEKK